MKKFVFDIILIFILTLLTGEIITRYFELRSQNTDFLYPDNEGFSSYKPNSSGNYVFGKPVTLDYERERYVNERFTNNVLPFEQVKVGPGLDDGYTAQPSGGLQQANKREYEIPKSVDELRYKTNPKLTYEGRVVDGQKASLPGEIGEVCKNRVDTVYEQTPDMYLKTGDTANSSRQSQRPCVDLKETNRSTTTLKGYDGNVTDIVKSITAPLLDTMKLSKKQYTTMHARPLGNFQNTNPSKLTIYDPNDVARTNATTTKTSEDVFIPGISTNYEIKKGFNLFGGVHKGFATVTPGNQADPEESVNYEIGSRFRSGDLFLESALFINDYKNLLVHA